MPTARYTSHGQETSIRQYLSRLKQNLYEQYVGPPCDETLFTVFHFFLCRALACLRARAAVVDLEVRKTYDRWPAGLFQSMKRYFPSSQPLTVCPLFLIFCVKLSINNRIVRVVHKNHIIRTCLMYHTACKVELQPFKRSYSQLTFFNFL